MYNKQPRRKIDQRNITGKLVIVTPERSYLKQKETDKRNTEDGFFKKMR